MPWRLCNWLLSCWLVLTFYNLQSPEKRLSFKKLSRSSFLVHVFGEVSCLLIGVASLWWMASFPRQKQCCGLQCYAQSLGPQNIIRRIEFNAKAKRLYGKLVQVCPSVLSSNSSNTSNRNSVGETLSGERKRSIYREGLAEFSASRLGIGCPIWKGNSMPEGNSQYPVTACESFQDSNVSVICPFCLLGD